MENLLKTLQKKHNLSPKEARKILQTITDYIKDRFPMISGAVDNFFYDEPADSSKASEARLNTNISTSGEDILE